MSYLMADAHQYHDHSYSHLPTPPTSTYAEDSVVLPKVGQTRCYWALLSSDLQFIYLDPVLDYHLGEQAELLVGKSLLSFVHPDEQASAKRDLGDVLDSKTLHGSVTRVRYSRLYSVRRQLGYVGPGPDWVDADKVALDKDYLAVDLVINWAADGLVLCFIHAIVDLNSIADNDEVHKTEWTNWCGTPWMPPEQIEILYSRFLMCIQQTGTMSRVFQILLNERERPLLLSWPPDSTQGPSSSDFAKLVENVQISAGVPGGSDAKTSCTRRYKALQDMPTLLGCQVESIFIPHGTIIFACHKVNSTRTTAMNQVDYHHYSQYYDQSSPYNIPPSLPAHDVAYSNGFSNNTYSAHRWQPALTQNIHNLRSEYPVASPPAWSSASPSASSASTTYLPSGPHTAAQAPFGRPLSPPQNYNTSYASMPSGACSGNSAVPVPSATGPDVVPPSRRRVSPTTTRDREPSVGHGHGHSPSSGPGPIRGSVTTSVSGTTGIGVSKPSGILKCSSCKTTQSPEWRKGPSGKKELCNACGLRYARSRAKKEGPLGASSRRRKADLTKRESATPPTLNPPYPPVTGTIRRNSTDANPSASASVDVYAPHSQRRHHPHHVLGDHFTPSPSPPTSVGVVTATGMSNVGYVNYATASGHMGHGHEINCRPHLPYSSISNTFYSTPSSLTGVQHVAQQHQNHSPPEPTPSPTFSSSHHQQMHSYPHSRQHHPHPHHANTHTQLPPLEQMKPALPSPMPPAYEHERDSRGHQQQQHVPLTPLSAGEPRDGYRKAM